MIAEIWKFVKQAAIFQCTHIQLSEYETKKHLNLFANEWLDIHSMEFVSEILLQLRYHVLDEVLLFIGRLKTLLYVLVFWSSRKVESIFKFEDSIFN